jgi:hypothetical protein
MFFRMVLFIWEYKNAGHCLFLMSLVNLNDFAVLAKTSQKCVTLFSEALLAKAASLQGGWGRAVLSQSPKSRVSKVGQELLKYRALRIGHTFQELSVFFT